ncbi:hypothetical protein DL764_007309 [Monosporascus ibericus]|uniref:Uncharacterized protein n=1 Tax=Monosporascus ibericus TaxID=155417 RepID=A0A4Q4T547_9PEZI|nr:hypothetical protein DL764_007309 [Monosporascus ibericus]
MQMTTGSRTFRQVIAPSPRRWTWSWMLFRRSDIPGRASEIRESVLQAMRTEDGTSPVAGQNPILDFGFLTSMGSSGLLPAEPGGLDLHLSDADATMLTSDEYLAAQFSGTQPQRTRLHIKIATHETFLLAVRNIISSGRLLHLLDAWGLLGSHRDYIDGICEDASRTQWHGRPVHRHVPPQGRVPWRQARGGEGRLEAEGAADQEDDVVVSPAVRDAETTPLDELGISVHVVPRGIAADGAVGCDDLQVREASSVRPEHVLPSRLRGLREQRARDRVAGAQELEVRGVARWQDDEVCLDVRGR